MVCRLLHDISPITLHKHLRLRALRRRYGAALWCIALRDVPPKKYLDVRDMANCLSSGGNSSSFQITTHPTLQLLCYLRSIRLRKPLTAKHLEVINETPYSTSSIQMARIAIVGRLRPQNRHSRRHTAKILSFAILAHCGDSKHYDLRILTASFWFRTSGLVTTKPVGTLTL